MAPTGSIARAIAACKVATLPDSADDLALLQQFDLRSLYVIPLVSQDKVIGVVLVGHKTIRQLTVRERQLAEALVNQAATAVRNAELYSQTDAALAARVTELSAIESISRQISGSLDLEAIINDVLDTAMVITGADGAGCGLVTDPEFLNFSERYGPALNMPPTRRVLRLGDGVIGRVMHTGQIARIGDVRTDPDYRRFDLSGTLSELCVPIIHRHECVGILNLESRRLDAFTELHAQFIANLADHAAIAIQNVRLFEERQIQIDTLIKLRDLSLSLLSATSLNAVMNVIAEYTLIISRAKDVHLYLYDRATDTLTFGASLWLDGRENIEASKPERGGTTWQVARTGRSQIVEDVSQLQPAPQFKHGPGYAAIARIALRRGNRVMGVLVVAYREPHHFSDNEMRTLDLLAYQAAIAIENARVFDEVRAGRDQMQVILDSTRDGMMLIGANGELVLANPAAERLLNQALQRYTGMPMMRLIARLHRQADDPTNGEAIVGAIRNLLASVAHNPHSAARSAFQVDIQGTLIDVEAIVLPVRDKAGQVNGRLAVLRDVSEEKSLERFRWQLTDMVVHDLRAPLSAVISGLQMAQDMVTEGDFADLNQVIAIALNSSRSQMYNIESILEISKLESASRIPLNMAVCPLKVLVDRAVAAIDLTAQDAGVRVVDLVMDDMPPLWVDEAQIRRVLINLLDNALRHTPTNGEVRIEAAPVSGRNCVQISVIDTGRGIPVDMRERIFEKFYQVSRSALRGQRGFGLGLTFCKLSIEAHGGKIWVDDGPEGGAAFRFILPFAAQEHQN
jgi:NtrC-family two-component system sensor histidine kinase KinB